MYGDVGMWRCCCLSVCGCVIVSVLYSVFEMFTCCPALTGIYLINNYNNNDI